MKRRNGSFSESITLMATQQMIGIEKQTIDPAIITWGYFTDFLPEKLKPSHLRQYDAGEQIKRLKQRVGQTVPELVTHLEYLETQLTETPTVAQRHSNLLHALHEYIKRAVLRHGTQGKTRPELIEAATVLERVEPKPDFIRNPTFTRGSGRGRGRFRGVFNPRAPAPPSSNPQDPSTADDTPQGSVNPPAPKRKREEDDDKADKAWQMICWGCKKKGHRFSECRSRSGKGRGRAT